MPILDRLRPKLWIAAAAFALAAMISLAYLANAQDSDEPNVDASWAAVLWDSYASAPYTNWSFEPGVPESHYVGVEPHGMVLRTFVNAVAAADFAAGASEYSAGAAIVKENHAPTGTDLTGLELQSPLPDFGGDLRAWTYMVKIPGYAPETGDWFYGRIGADGSVMAAGSPEGCVACHAQVADGDWVFNAPLGD